MTATILQFPKPFAYPEHWTGYHQYIFDYLREYHGLSIEEAEESIEEDIHVQRIIPGETTHQRDDRLLRESVRLAVKRSKRGAQD